MAIEKVGVVGCGLMGSGIAQVAAQSNYEVIVLEASEELLEKGVSKIEKFLLKGVDKGKMKQSDMDAVLGRINGTTDYSDMAASDIVIEAVTESMELKGKVYAALSEACKPEAIFASNTSSLSITEIAAMTKRPDKMVGLHFFNPVPLMKLVEVVRCLTTSSETFDTAYKFIESLGKTPIGCKDSIGFVVNRLLVPYLLDAVRQLESGLAGVEEIDKGMRLGCGYPMGPFTLLDFVGIDTTLYIADIMFEQLKLYQYSAPPLLRRMTAAGYTGRKSGKGFYDYSQEPPVASELGL